MAEQLYVCRSVFTHDSPSILPPVLMYLERITRKGDKIDTKWTANKDAAMRVNAKRRNALIDGGFRGRGFGRWVRDAAPQPEGAAR